LDCACGNGDRLAELEKRGYRAITGIERSGALVKECQTKHKHVGVTVHHSNIQDFAPKLRTGQFAVIFAANALGKLPADSNVFGHLARSTVAHLITIEDERKRNYGEIFTNLGLVQRKEIQLSGGWVPRLFINICAAPTASLYARSPSDLRLGRRFCQYWHERRHFRKLEACYVGVSYGEDFFSWYPMHLGTGLDVTWTVTDVVEKCLFHVEHLCEVKTHLGHFHDGLPGKPQLVVANHIYTCDKLWNTNGLLKLLSGKPALLISRDHKLNPKELKDVIPADYQVYDHAVERSRFASDAFAPIFLRKDVPYKLLQDTYTVLKRIV
jgi:SAM-dependent methyltransferase